MDIADRRQPQDGRYVVDRGGRTVDARVSSMPTIAGERLVVRLLESESSIPNLAGLGMEPEMVSAYGRVLHSSSGFIVICGPTGSGKTTTAYASLCNRHGGGQHLCSVEDPVEIRIPGIHDNETIVLGGLVRDASTQTISKVPGLGDIPLIGGLFKNKQASHERDEIVFLITPHIIYPGTRPPAR